MPAAPIAPDIQPARTVPGLAGFKASLFGLSRHMESLIDHAGRRGALMLRAHEALEDGASQAQLAIDRFEAFMEDRLRGPGLLRKLGRALHLGR
jgi:phospholipase C